MLYHLKRGALRFTRLTPQGQTLTLRHVRPGDIFGEEVFFGRHRRHNLEALTDARLEVLTPEWLSQNERSCVLRSLADQLQRLSAFDYHLQAGSLETRVARYLCDLATTDPAHRDDAGYVTLEASPLPAKEPRAPTRVSRRY